MAEVETQGNVKIERIPKVWTPDAKLWISHEDKNICFAYPSFQGTYLDVGKEVLANKLSIPTGDYTSSLIHSAYFSSEKKEPELKKIRENIRDYWIWIFNKNLWTSEGVYVVQDGNAEERFKQLNPNELEKLLTKEKNNIRFSEDGRVRFAPKGSYKLGDHTPDSLSKNGFVIASYGDLGAKKLGEVSTQFSSNPYVYGLNIEEGQDPELTVSALVEYDVRLHVDGDFFGGLNGGHAFGVLETCEAGAKK